MNNATNSTEMDETNDQSGHQEIDIMEKLHKKKMEVIEQNFAKKEKGLTIQEFLKVMLEHLDYNREN